MAGSPSHQFGQMIGDLLEVAIATPLHDFADQKGLYLDKKGRRAVRTGRKVSWTDGAGNKHDLDFVLERGGTEREIGAPVAFIETAWRRYTKHSRNTAQEIQGAIEPLLKMYSDHRPLGAVVLAGVFTEGALAQLRSRGFAVAYLPYQSVVAAFAEVGIDADFDEQTPDDEFAQKVAAWNALPQSQRNRVAAALLEINESALAVFLRQLRAVTDRRIEGIVVLALHGIRREFRTASEALSYVSDYDESHTCDDGFERYEIVVRFTNGDEIEGSFANKDSAGDFLALLAP